ncbi:MAG: flagellar hook protein FlgE [Desulfovibrionales bacterium]|nr:flagellar hook protein FlgE [Desulfovibrionales bacterium]
MSVIGSMYTGISGLDTHAQRMSVLGNNLANTSTLGFKSASVNFEDLFYSSRSLGASVGQVGHGAKVSSIYQNFAQGAFENTGSATDVAVGGNGFFIVNDPQKGSEYYTRAGNFVFDENGFLVDPSGMRVQGWDAIAGKDSVPQPTGAIGDLKLDSFQSPPKSTTTMNVSFNLNKKSIDNTVADLTGATTDAEKEARKMFGMFNAWDGTKDTPIGENGYEYQTTMNVFDKSGAAHEVTVYFDKAFDKSGKQVWEYIVTVNPEEDGRADILEARKAVAGGTPTADDTKNAQKAGLLMSGTMSFTASGSIDDMSAYTYQPAAAGENPYDETKWSPAKFDANGFPVFTANFTKLEDVNDTDDAASGEAPEVIALDFGFGSKGTEYNSDKTIDQVKGGEAIAGIDPAEVNKTSKAPTAYDAASSTHSQNQDGYTAGFLQEITIDRNGCVYGRYSNGRKEELFMLGLADFSNKQGLTLQGGNLYSKSTASGEAVVGTANTGRFGSVASNTLELSNVDVSRQMVKLITTQRGYQSNSKVITTSDEMLQEAINLKQ